MTIQWQYSHIALYYLWLLEIDRRVTGGANKRLEIKFIVYDEMSKPTPLVNGRSKSEIPF